MISTSWVLVFYVLLFNSSITITTFYPVTFSSEEMCNNAGWIIGGKMKKQFLDDNQRNDVKFECVNPGKGN